MAKVKYVVGCPAWDRAWSLPLWFKSIKANCPPKQTGLIFVVPATDQATRDTINEHAKDFAWLEVERDKREQFDRSKRAQDDNHETLAAARNQLLRMVNQAKPQFYLSWDSDLLLPPHTVRAIENQSVPISTAWTWLNRQKPHTTRCLDDSGDFRWVEYQEPMAATAMQWEHHLLPEHRRRGTGMTPVHYQATEWNKIIRRGLFKADVVLGFQMMRSLVYTTTHYQPHPCGEDIPFNRSLHVRGIPRHCLTRKVGVHLYKRDEAELKLGWPGIMDLAEQKPLAARRTEPRSENDEILGLYPLETQNGHAKPVAA